MGLAYIAAVAEKAGHDVRVIDAEASEISFSEIETEIREFDPQVIGFQTFCANLPRCNRVAQIARSVNPEIKIVYGGVQATLFPEEQLAHPFVDVVVLGEGELPFQQLLDAWSRGISIHEVGSIAFKDESDKIVTNSRLQLIQSLDDLPFPALHLFPMKHYHSSAQLRGRRTLHLMTSRGCPYNCSYCSGDLIFGRTFRFRSPEKVIDDIHRLVNAFGMDSIQFYDETFTVNRDRVYALCDALDASGLSLPWACFTRVDLVDRELLTRMRDSGCYQIFFGVETGVPRLLKIIRKGTTLDQARKAFKLTRELGIETVASFMLTLPGEKYEDTQESIRFGIELDPDYIYWLTFVPYPGNDLTDLARQSGRIINEDATTYNVFNEIVYVPEDRDPEEIRQTVARAYRRFYLRPRYVIRQMKKLFTLPPDKAWNLIKGGLRTFLKKKV